MQIFTAEYCIYMYMYSAQRYKIFSQWELLYFLVICVDSNTDNIQGNNNFGGVYRI